MPTDVPSKRGVNNCVLNRMLKHFLYGGAAREGCHTSSRVCRPPQIAPQMVMS